MMVVPILMEAHAWLRGAWSIFLNEGLGTWSMCSGLCESSLTETSFCENPRNTRRSNGVHVNRLFPTNVSYAHPPHWSGI